MKRDFRLLMVIIMFVFSIAIGTQKNFVVITSNEYNQAYNTMVKRYDYHSDLWDEAEENFNKTYFQSQGVYFKATYNWKEAVFLFAFTALVASVTLKKEEDEVDILQLELEKTKKEEITKATP